jgi:ribosomal protein S18 acetylase RimI-like enzyme
MKRRPFRFRHAFAMDVRTATPEDADAIGRLAPSDNGLPADGLAFVAEDDGRAVGALVADAGGTIHAVGVAEERRGTGVARALAQALVAALAERDVDTVRLDVSVHDAETHAMAERFGFRVERQLYAVGRADLASRLAETGGACYGAIHVQTDDTAPLQRALGHFVPRLPDIQLNGPRNGWLELTDRQLDADPKLLRRLARELSVISGSVVFVIGVEDGAVVRYALLDRGSLVDEYLSVPEFHGALPSGEVVALGANPTAVARLMGADATKVRAVARTASSPQDLPPADELYRQIVEAVGLPA